MEKSIEYTNEDNHDRISRNYPLDKKYQQFELYFNEETNEKIQAFCETFCIEFSKFIDATVRNKLFNIADDIEGEYFDVISVYFKTSKLVNECPLAKSNEKLEKEIKVEAQFPLLISKAIKHLCEEIPLTPEEFIVGLISKEIDFLIDNIEDDCFEFLANYKNFSKFRKVIDKIYENTPNKFKKKE